MVNSFRSNYIYDLENVNRLDSERNFIEELDNNQVDDQVLIKPKNSISHLIDFFENLDNKVSTIGKRLLVNTETSNVIKNLKTACDNTSLVLKSHKPECIVKIVKKYEIDFYKKNVKNISLKNDNELLQVSINLNQQNTHLLDKEGIYYYYKKDLYIISKIYEFLKTDSQKQLSQEITPNSTDNNNFTVNNNLNLENKNNEKKSDNSDKVSVKPDVEIKDTRKCNDYCQCTKCLEEVEEWYKPDVFRKDSFGNVVRLRHIHCTLKKYEQKVADLMSIKERDFYKNPRQDIRICVLIGAVFYHYDDYVDTNMSVKFKRILKRLFCFTD